MSASKESNSSKTAHVMNLLSRTRANPAAEAAAQEKAVQPAEAAVPPTPTAAAVLPTPTAAAVLPTPTAAAPAPAPAPAESAPQSTPPTSPIIASLSSDHAISSQIKDALASSLEERAESEPAAETPPAPVVEEVPQPKSVAEEPAAPVIEEVPQPEPVVETPPAPVAVDSAAEKPDEEEVICANIMEILVERKAETYMELFGLCCCDRCKMDVQALALTELPPKYVVMAKNELPLRLSLYEGRMNTAVTAQILRACKVVLAEPRHKLFPL